MNILPCIRAFTSENTITGLKDIYSLLTIQFITSIQFNSSNWQRYSWPILRSEIVVASIHFKESDKILSENLVFLIKYC